MLFPQTASSFSTNATKHNRALRGQKELQLLTIHLHCFTFSSTILRKRNILLLPILHIAVDESAVKFKNKILILVIQVWLSKQLT